LAKEILAVRNLEIPKNVEIKLEGNKVIVKGSKGQLEKDFSHMKGISMEIKDNNLIVQAFFADAKKKAAVGTVIAHVKNMITAVSYTHLTLPTILRV